MQNDRIFLPSRRVVPRRCDAGETQVRRRRPAQHLVDDIGVLVNTVNPISFFGKAQVAEQQLPGERRNGGAELRPVRLKINRGIEALARRFDVSFAGNTFYPAKVNVADTELARFFSPDRRGSERVRDIAGTIDQE